MAEEISAVQRMQEILRSMESEGISEEYPVPAQTAGEKVQNVEKASESSGEADAEAPLLQLDSENVLRGIILSEVLGKPVSKRRGRW